jgi:transcriptional regulator with XRE-family HTH domain
MVLNHEAPSNGLKGHALRNSHLRQRALVRAQQAPPLARTLVTIRAQTLGLTRLEFSRRSGMSRSTLRDLELGLHTPTRRILQKFVTYCRQNAVNVDQLEGLCRLYVGPADTLEQFIARLEFLAGSPRELARRVSISPATLWEYRRGNFPLPWTLLRQLCQAVGEDSAAAEALWHQTERRRFLQRGYPEALAEFWVRCTRAGLTEKELLARGMSHATARRLRYLELPPWPAVAVVARLLCMTDDELLALEKLWKRAEKAQRDPAREEFGLCLKRLREAQGISRRELADFFGIGGKKPAGLIRHIEEDGFFSALAYPAGLVAIIVRAPAEQTRLLDLWQQRRKQFHCRRRPETRIDLRLCRERYGFGLRDMEPILGYSGLEFQRIERGVTALAETARARILQALHQAGQRRVEALLRRWTAHQVERLAWRSPTSVAGLVSLLAKREGGLVPLARYLKEAGLSALWPGRLQAITRGTEVPAWGILEQIAKAGGVADLSEVRRDWTLQYRTKLRKVCSSPLGVELRLLIAEVAPTLRAFSPRLGVNYSVLVRDLQRIDRDEPVRWYHVERILRALGLSGTDERWRELRALWSTAGERRKPGNSSPHRRPAVTLE